MTDVEKRAHDLAIAYTTNSYKAKNSTFPIDDEHPFEFGSAYEHAYE